ncbi:MAG: cyclic peptide export ABC transporter [Burkholderiales bacterium]
MSSFDIFRFLLQNSRSLAILMLAAGMLSGLFSAGVLAFISRALNTGTSVPNYVVLGFVALAAGKIVTNLVAQLLLVRFSQGTVLELSISLCEKILRAPLRAIEKRGSARVLATLTEDVSHITWAVQCLPQFAMNAAVVIGCGLYLAWLSWQMFLGVAIVTLLGGFVHKLMHARAFGRIHAAREARSRLFEHFRSVTSGVKELMMHSGRREAFVNDELRPAADDYRRSNLAAAARYAVAEAWVQVLFYGLIGLLLFAFPIIARPTPEALTGYVFAMLYMMGPIWSLVGLLPNIARGQVALVQIQELGVSLVPESPVAVDPAAQDPSQSRGEDVVNLRQVVFSYESDSEKSFTLGPIDFRMRAGELIFVVGGNGSGKSTFVKVLTGLYAPKAGSMTIGDVPITDTNRGWYRDHFSTVFADFHLFDKLLGLSGSDLEATTQRYLQLLQMDHKVSMQGGRFSTIDLSQGQRKRLALVTAYLEDRPFYVFDEWAADQDPEYKEVFYSKLLPDLRNRGKAVVVITHDDRYFHLGDRVVKLEDGHLARPIAVAPVLGEPAVRLAS